MKRNFKIKLLSLIGMGSVLALPMLTLTACGRVSQWYLPVAIGGSNANDGPFKTLLSSPTPSFPDLDTNNIADYVQSNYAYYINPSSSSDSTSTYSYAAPNDLSNPDESIQPYEYQWLSNNDSKLGKVSYTTKEGDKTINHFDHRNWNLLTTSQAVNTISSNVSQLLSYMLYYQLHLVNAYVANNDPTNLNALYGGSVNFGTKGNANFTDYFEFNFDLANLMSGPNSHIKFGQSGCDIDITSTLNENGLGFLTYQGANDGVGPSGAVDNMLDPDYVYVDKTEKDPDDETKTIVKSYRQIPFIFDVDDLTFSYFDPLTKDKSFLPQPWLIQDKEKVNKQLKSSSEWNNFKKVTGADKQISSLTWDVNLSTSTNGLTLSSHVDQEPTLSKNKGIIKPSSFIGLASYFIDSVTNKEGDTETTVKYPVFSQVSGIYPAYFLQDDSVFAQKEEGSDTYFLDKNKLDDKMKDFVSFLTDRNAKPTDERNGIKYFFSTYDGSKWTANTSAIFTKLI